jgi:hypothetical protein
MMIDLSLKNSALYEGCKISKVAGRLNLETSMEEAVNIIGRNIAKIVEAIPANERNQIAILTGPMAVWSYLVVFHSVVHVFPAVAYFDGRTPPVIVACHGSLLTNDFGSLGHVV